MALPEAWPVAASRGDFTAAAGWFCFSFDCFSLDCATATSDKHANPNTRILLFIFSLLCAGKRIDTGSLDPSARQAIPIQTQRCWSLAQGPASYGGNGLPGVSGAL